MEVLIKATKFKEILKFEVDKPIFTDHEPLEVSRQDNLSGYPFAKVLFQLPFVSKVFFSERFIAVKKVDTIDWELIKDNLATKISELLKEKTKIQLTPKNKMVTVYIESTPNPNVNKFISNKPLTSNQHEFKKGDDYSNSDLVQKLFENDFLEEVFIKENYIALTKSVATKWKDIQADVRDAIQNYLNTGKSVLISDNEVIDDTKYESLDSTSRQIIETLAEYIEPAVSSDGGNIEFKSYNSTNGEVLVTLRGACSGCPSSTFTLKNAIESTLKNIIGNDKIKSVIAETQ